MAALSYLWGYWYIYVSQVYKIWLGSTNNVKWLLMEQLKEVTF